MAYIFSNKGITTITADSDTTITVAGGTGDDFPIVASPDVCPCVMRDVDGRIEIVHITTRANGSDSFTVSRGEEGTTQLSWSSGDIIETCTTAEALNVITTHLHSGSYAVIGHTHDGSYLNVTGDTMAGDLTMPVPATSVTDTTAVPASWMRTRYDNFDIASSFNTVLLNGQTVLRLVVAKAFTLPSGLTGSQFFKLTAGDATAGTSVFTIYKNGASQGTNDITGVS